MPIAATIAHIAAMQAERDRRAAASLEKERQVLNLRALHESDERTKIYRAEKAAGLARHDAKMAEAKAAWNRLLADLQDAGKGGRPRKLKLSVHSDPADALIHALGESRWQ